MAVYLFIWTIVVILQSKLVHYCEDHEVTWQMVIIWLSEVQCTSSKFDGLWKQNSIDHLEGYLFISECFLYIFLHEWLLKILLQNSTVYPF